MLSYKDIKLSNENTGKILRELLNIKDTNIHFPVNAVQSEDYRGLRVKMIYAVFNLQSLWVSSLWNEDDD